MANGNQASVGKQIYTENMFASIVHCLLKPLKKVQHVLKQSSFPTAYNKVNNSCLMFMATFRYVFYRCHKEPGFKGK